MRNLLFVLASTATFAIINPAIAQYGQPGAPGIVPGNTPPGYTPPSAPGYKWREQRLNEDPRRSDSAGQQSTQPSPNNATSGVGVTDPNAAGGECAKGFSEETCRRRGQRYNPSR